MILELATIDECLGIEKDDKTLKLLDGKKRKLKTSDIRFRYGKYGGQKLSEVNNKHYLLWCRSRYADDYFVKLSVDLRLKQLK